MFQNLVDNALKYAKPATTVRVAARPAGEGRVAVAVSDEGDGIPAAHLPRLTERFYRVDAARSRQLGGTGLGLAIVKHVVNRHRGRLDIQSTPGKGSTFTVTLPAAGLARRRLLHRFLCGEAEEMPPGGGDGRDRRAAQWPSVRGYRASSSRIRQDDTAGSLVRTPRQGAYFSRVLRPAIQSVGRSLLSGPRHCHGCHISVIGE